MIRLFARHRLVKVAAARERRPAGGRVVRFIVLSLGAGAIAALLAILLAVIPALIVLAFPTSDSTEVLASKLFPTPSPTTKVINVYDPPSAPPAPPRATQPPESSGGGGGGDD